jgi:hypothetical protein
VQEEHQLSATAHVKDSGKGFIQVPLPEKKQLIGIKFKRAEMAAIFLGKIRAEMSKTLLPLQELHCLWYWIVRFAMSTMKTADTVFPLPTLLSPLSHSSDVAGLVTLQAVVLDEKPSSGVPNPDKLPRRPHPPILPTLSLSLQLLLGMVLDRRHYSQLPQKHKPLPLPA